LSAAARPQVSTRPQGAGWAFVDTPIRTSRTSFAQGIPPRLVLNCIALQYPLSSASCPSTNGRIRVAESETRPGRVAILGAGGWMGRVHALSYVKLAHVFGDSRGGAEIAWLVDNDPRQLARASANHPGARTSADWRAVFEDDSVNLVDICLPDNFHY